MTMSQRDRILTVYRGDTPDVVPFMLDLSHWFYHKHKLPWDISIEYTKPEYALIDYHKKVGAGFYMPNTASVYSSHYAEDVEVTVTKSDDVITWKYETPLGTIQRERLWDEKTYSWAISDWAVKTEQDLKVLGYALGSITFQPLWDRYQAWVDYIGDIGVAYLPFGYSAMGYLLSYWMGIEGTIYAATDWNKTMHEVVDQINSSNLRCIDLMAASPAEIIILGDNFSSDIQPPHFFAEWSRAFYIEAISRLHAAGKYIAVHIDGKLRGALAMFAEIKADCADAVTPIPMGDLSPEECRKEAGPDMILSGGVSPDLWYPNVSIESFKDATLRWLKLKKHGPRIIANAGDQVPPGAEEERILIMRDLIEKHGKY